MDHGPNPRLDLMQGTLDLLILKALAWEPRHGYGIARWLEETTDDALGVEEGSLYPALHRMAERRWVKAEWGRSENNRRAKYYSLTVEGRRQLGVEMSNWLRFVEAMGKVLEARPAVPLVAER